MRIELNILSLCFCLTAAALLAMIMALRLNKAVKKLKTVTREITWLVYLAVGMPLLIVAGLFSMSLLLFLILWVILAFPVSYHFNKKYNIWLAARLKDKKRQENLEKLMEMQMKERP